MDTIYSALLLLFSLGIPLGVAVLVVVLWKRR